MEAKKEVTRQRERADKSILGVAGTGELQLERQGRAVMRKQGFM